MSTQSQPTPEERRREAVARIHRRRRFYRHLLAYALVNVFLIVIWVVSGDGFFWPIFVLFGWGIGLAFNALDVFCPGKPSEKRIREEMDRMSRRPGP